MLRAVANAIIDRAMQTPFWHLKGYMNRYWLVPFETPDGADGCVRLSWRKRPVGRLLQKLGVSIRVHEILRSDADRDPHDHPWKGGYLTVILRGNGYIEHLFNEQAELVISKMHRPGAVLYRGRDCYHMLELPDGPVWTLFIMFGNKKPRGWGFNVNGTFVPRRDYQSRNRY